MVTNNGDWLLVELACDQRLGTSSPTSALGGAEGPQVESGGTNGRWSNPSCPWSEASVKPRMTGPGELPGRRAGGGLGGWRTPRAQGSSMPRPHACPCVSHVRPFLSHLQ